MGQYTLALFVALTIAPAVTGTLSLLGSGSIIWVIVRDMGKRLGSIKYRLLCGLSFWNLVNTLWYVVWSIPQPRGTPNIWGALGNKASCDAQGFFIQLGVSGSFYSAALSWFYMFSICNSLSRPKVQRKHEVIAHAI